jgi:hypothetical protein
MHWFSEFARLPLEARGGCFAVVTKDESSSLLFHLAPDSNLYVHDGNFVIRPLRFFLVWPDDEIRIAKLDPQVQRIRLIAQPEPTLPSIKLIEQYSAQARLLVHDVLLNALTAPIGTS